MEELGTAIFGPLAPVETRRALGGKWMIALRAACSLPAAVLIMVTLLVWVLASAARPSFLPGDLLRIMTMVVQSLSVTAAVLLAPALLAGSIAAEKERGTLELLLISRVTPHEVVSGRLAGKLAVMAVVLAAGMPLAVLLGSMAGVQGTSMLALVLLPLAVALGSAGVSVLASTVARRGRDALLGVYLGAFVIMLLLQFVVWMLPQNVQDWLYPLYPYYPLFDLIFRNQSAVAWQTIFLWSSFGVVCTLLAGWRLRPAYLKYIGGYTPKGDVQRRGRVPPISERPMLWKELFIEKTKTFGKAGNVLGGVLAGSLLVGAVGMGGLVYYYQDVATDTPRADWWRYVMAIYIGSSSTYICYLIQWAIGMRAAVAINSERQNATWDGLLMSPLEGHEIVWGKLWGSLYAMRMLVGAVLIAWLVGALFGAMELSACLLEFGSAVIIGAFMAACGVWLSLYTESTTKAMGLIIGVWLVAKMLFAAIAVVLTGIIAALLFLAWEVAMKNPNPGPLPIPISFSTGWTIVNLMLFVVATVVVATYCHKRFDAIAGRGLAGLVMIRVPAQVVTPRRMVARDQVEVVEEV